MKLPQLTLRDLFWLVALVAMGCGWWVERERDRARDELLKQPLSEIGGVSKISKATAP